MFFDIGANIGRWSLTNMHNAENIVALEADPDTFKVLQLNAENRNIIPLNYVVCNCPNDEIDFFKCESHTISTINEDWLADEKSRFYGSKYQKIRCKTITLDTLIQQYGKPKLIKIDVEGGEYECVTSLTQKVDELCFEWASELKDIAFLCLDYLKTIGFTKFYIQYEDAYLFRPTYPEYKEIDIIKDEFNKTVPKEHWGMIWCR